MFTAVVIEDAKTEEERAFSKECNVLGSKIHEAVKTAAQDCTDPSMMITALARVVASFILHAPGSEEGHHMLCCAIHEMLHLQVKEFYAFEAASKH